MTRTYKKSGGFTLVELLAVIVVFMVIGTIIMSILVTSLRTSSKTNLLSSVRANGNYAISEMSKLIRNARVLQSPFPCGTNDNPTTTTSATITTPDNLLVTFACTGTTVASNGASLIDTNAVKVTSCQFTCTQQNPTDYPVIKIQLGIAQATGGNFFENFASPSAIPFETSVVLRNLNR